MTFSKENSCAFYASDYHLEMIMLPYINENLKQNKNIYIFTQNNLEETINKLIDRVNLENGMKEKVLNINWKNDDENKYNKLINDNKQIVIFIKGNEEYIEKINNDLKQVKAYEKMQIVDCYNLEEIGKRAQDIAKKHKKIIMTNKN